MNDELDAADGDRIKRAIFRLLMVAVVPSFLPFKGSPRGIRLFLRESPLLFPPHSAPIGRWEPSPCFSFQMWKIVRYERF